MHVRDGKLRAFVDGELSQAEYARMETHLKSCARCRKRLMKLREEVAALDEPLRLLAPRTAQHSHAGHALARLQTQVETDDKLFAGGVTLRNIGLNRNWQRALGGLAVVAVVAVLLSFAPVRAAASELLAVFRLENIVILPVSVQDFERLEDASYELGEDFFPGEMEMLSEPGEAQFPETLAEASDLAGYAVRSPATHPDPTTITVNEGATARYTPDLESIQLLFEAADLSPDLVPPEIDGQTFEFSMSSMVTQSWFEEEQEFLTVGQMPSPTVEFPDEVDERALGMAMLQLMGLSPEEAAALSATIDWSSTLVLPLPADEVSYEPVTVDGSDGFVLTPTSDESEEAGSAVIWQKDGMVYFVAATGDTGRLLEIANSLQ